MRDSAEILRRLNVALEDTQRGYQDLTGADPTRRQVGLRNMVVFGRSVTQVAQTWRAIDRDRFDAWYAPYETEMAKDPLTVYFNTLRSIILKEGAPQVGTSFSVMYLDTADLPPAPPGAGAFFMGDPMGGSGWEIEQPDGTTEKFYVDLPPEIVTSW
jgi:hypothetical protein